MDYQTFISDSLNSASEIANKNFGKIIAIEEKGTDNNQVLTQTDLSIGHLLVQKIKEAFPNDNIIDEEAGAIDKKSNLTWVVDPIDGTSNFANGVPLYGIMLGLLEDGKPIAGGVALPFFNEIYFGEKGKGASCNNQKINVTNQTNLLKSLVSYGIDGHQEKPEMTREEAGILGEIVLNIRNLRTSNSCFDLMMVAKGAYGAFLNRTSKIWDNVAPQIIIEEAGGTYTDYFGSPIDYSNPISKLEQNFTVCAAPTQLHSKLQEIIRKS